MEKRVSEVIYKILRNKGYSEKQIAEVIEASKSLKEHEAMSQHLAKHNQLKQQ